MAATSAPLPIAALLPQLLHTLASDSRAILQAPPGAGKSTAVAPALLDQPWLNGRRILLLEPRRLAARNVARYMAQGLGEAVGETVGYRMRFDRSVGPRTRIEVVTEGILTRQLQQDPALESVGLVIFDEFHERSLQADLGLALCLDAQAALRPDLRLLIMSATLEHMPLAARLDGAPVLRSEGRSFEVRHRYRPPRTRYQRDRRAFLSELALTVRQALQEEAGSVLVFVPGVGEIRQLLERLQASALPGDVDLTPLYGDLDLETQQRAIAPAPPGRRKVVLATAIAETSLTIDGIRVVVDSGLMRVPRFDPRTGMSRLETQPVSQASAAQRCGRAGRLEPGVCYRLWSAHEHGTLAPHAGAEILEADLAPLALELAQWGVQPEQLRWLDPPPTPAYRQACDLLQALGALDGHGHITAHGRAMAELGLHPRLAHMVLRGARWGYGDLACEIAALLEERDILPRQGEPDCDLRTRLDRLHDRGRRTGLLERVRRAAGQCRQRMQRLDAGVSDAGPDAADAPGLLLALAYPDRIAQRREGADGRYLLVNGTGAVFTQADALAVAPYLAVAQVDGAGREARILLAAEVSRAALLAQFADRIRTREHVQWDERQGAVLARRQRRLGALVLADEPWSDADPQRLAECLLEGIRRTGLACLPWNSRLRAWQARMEFLQRQFPGQFPDLSDDALLQNLDRWLAPFVTGMSRLDHLSRLDLHNALVGQLDWNQQRRADELAPSHLQVPSGSRIALDYSGEVPVLAVRLQELFGCQETPRIADGTVAVLVHLLSPAGRPVQVTRDLAGFWRNSYFDVRKDLRGRYPKHHWPDDPLTAAPTRHAKRRR